MFLDIIFDVLITAGSIFAIVLVLFQIILIVGDNLYL